MNLAGKFIVLDGGEGCGKSTQARLLQERLESQETPVLLVRDPGTTRVGEMVRAILLDPDNTDIAMRCEMLLYMAARAQMMTEVILPALNAGQIVLCDRFVSSTLAYQLGGDNLAEAEIRAVADVAIQKQWPDLTLILDMPIEASIARVQAKFERTRHTTGGEAEKTLLKDRIEQRPTSYHQTVRENYLAQAKADPQRVKIIAANQDPQTVHHDIWDILTQSMQCP